MADQIPDLLARLAALDDAPVAGHPDVLEAVHRELLAELEELAGGTAPPRDAPGQEPRG